MEAKDELLSIIDQRLNEKSSDFLTKFLEETSDNVMDVQTMKNHVLVFICALIPKVKHLENKEAVKLDTLKIFGWTKNNKVLAVSNLN
jgi:hypothetical protein